MIERMQHLTLLALESERDRTLVMLRDFGAVELDLSHASGTEFTTAKDSLEKAERAIRIVRKAAAEVKGPREPALDCLRKELVDRILAADAAREESAAKVAALERLVRAYAPFGDFDPALARQVAREVGLEVSLLKVLDTKLALTELPVQNLAPLAGVAGDKNRYCVAFSVGAFPATPGVEVVALPEQRLAAMREELVHRQQEVQEITSTLAGTEERCAEIEAMYPGIKDRIEFAAAQEALGANGAVVWIEGWIPAERVPSLRAKASFESWGLSVRDPENGETPPVLITPPKFFRSVRVLFAGLGIAPAYDEADVSVPFLCYFSLFFAMLVGDGGYGALILALTLFGWKKTKPKSGHRPVLVRSWLTLLTVFSLATVAWGCLSNTWFGAGLPFAKNWPTVKWLGDSSYHNMMLLCFTIGVSHLMLARIWNGVCKLNSTKCLADFGWAGILLFMYFVTNSIVGIFAGIPKFMYSVFGGSVACVILFTLKPSELKTRGAELGMLPLNIMSTLGDIISYVRLFAVGLASVKVAENFNQMAVGLLSPDHAWWLNALLAVGTVAILLVGHALNFAMAGLSILVHAVRLNTLEFSNHKGVTWSGSAFNPFKKH